jgi:phosphotriesterase-related protein
MAHINTVLGPVHPEEISITAIHEHLMSGLPGWEYDPGFWFDMGTAFEDCYNSLMDFKLLGGQTYVDCSGITSARDVDVLVKLASSIRDMNIIGSTGFRGDSSVAPHFRRKDAAYFEELFVHEIIHGMGKTGVQAGIICVGVEGNFTGLEEMVYRAAARAARRTGVPVIARGIETVFKQLQILSDEGLNSDQIVVSHLDSSGFVNIERDKQIARTGAYVAYDQVGILRGSKGSSGLTDEDRVRLILSLLDAGLQDQILLSTSSECQPLGWGQDSVHSVSHLLRYFLPKLREAGVDQATINTILVENPRRVLAINKSSI